MPYDPMDAGIDWNGTGYGTGDPNANGFLEKLGKWMPYVVAGIFTAGALQAAGLLPGMSSAEAASIDASSGAGAAGAAAGAAMPTVVPELPWTLPAADIAGEAGVIPGVTLGAGGTAGLNAAGGGAGALAKNLLSTRGATSIAALIPALTALGKSGNGGPFGGGQTGTDIGNEVLAGLQGQRKRFEATGPAFETAQNMALGMAPTRYRSSTGPFGGPA